MNWSDYQEYRRKRKKDSRGEDDDTAQRLEDGFDLLNEYDPKDPLTPLVTDHDTLREDEGQ